MIVAVRRLFASLILTSVLFGTVGGAHPACAALPVNGRADGRVMSDMVMKHAHAPQGSRDEMGETGGVESTEGGDYGTDQGTDPGARPGGGHECVPPPGCATVAHCIAVAVAPSASPPLGLAVLPQQPREARVTCPRSPTREPDFPPPRV